MFREVIIDFVNKIFASLRMTKSEGFRMTDCRVD